MPFQYDTAHTCNVNGVQTGEWLPTRGCCKAITLTDIPSMKHVASLPAILVLRYVKLPRQISTQFILPILINLSIKL